MAGLLVLLALLFASPASASYESVGSINGEPGPMLNRPSGIAVNYTGAGGVPVGTVYAVNMRGWPNAGGLVLSYDAQGKFRQAWGWGVADEEKEFERCGPAGEAAHPTCKGADEFEMAAFSGEGAGQLSEPRGIAVDQSTGDVYVLNKSRIHNAVQIFTATGEPVGGFGETASSASAGEPVVTSPEKIHDSNFANRIAVDASGTVYIGDEYFPLAEARVMVFKPQTPGDPTTYEYTGQGNDIGGPNITYTEGAVAIDEAGNLYLANKEFISEFAPGASTPSCRYKVPGGQLLAMTVNPKSGEVFLTNGGKFRQLAACNAQGEFKEKSSFAAVSKAIYLYPLAIDPVLSYEPGRPAGIFYSGNETAQFGGISVIEVFAPAVVHSPRVESQSVSAITTSSAALHAQIDPEGSQTSYRFQYLTQAEYEANEPDELQSLAVSATEGVFGLAFEGHRYGGEGSLKLTSGSTAATELHTAKGTATFKGAVGSATVKAARGQGTLVAGAKTVLGLSTSEGAFEVGQEIEQGTDPSLRGGAIPFGTTITAVGPNELTLSTAPVETKADAFLIAGSHTLESVATTEGTFEVGQGIGGKGIPTGSTILAVGSGQLTISGQPYTPGTSVAIQAGSNTLTSVTTSEGRFEVGQEIEGEGIPPLTKVKAVEGNTLTISDSVTSIGTGIAIAATGPPFAPGQRIEGAGIPPETTIAAIGNLGGKLTLSNPASASGTVSVHAGLPFDASRGEVRNALEGLPGIGTGNVAVSGGPGDESGSSPYRVQFTGELSDTDQPLIEAEGIDLSGGSATATVQGVHNGGGDGFAGAKEAPPGGAILGTGQQVLSATAGLVGLEPDTSYRYRAVASSPCNPDEEEVPCETFGKAGSFRTFPTQAPELPDRRAYELVSPTDKAGGEVFRLNPWRSSCLECNQLVATAFPKQSSPDGEALVYEAGPLANSGTALKENEYLARRTASGWQSTNLTPERLNNLGSEIGFKAFDTNLNRGLLGQVSPSLTSDAPSEYANLYGFSTADPADLSPLIGAQAPNRSPDVGPNGLSLIYAGATPDLSHTLFEANDALTGETSSAPKAVDGGAKKNNLYESVEGELRLVNVLPGNTETVPGASFGSGLALAKASNEYDFDNAISTDGSRIFWSDETGQVYVREGGERTTEIPDHTGTYLTASPDGSKLLLSDGVLYDLETEAEVDLTEGKGGFEGIAGNSEDLSSIYFVDTAALKGGGNERGERPQNGQSNLYLFRGGEATFIATLDKKNEKENDNEQAGSVVGGDWRAPSGHRSAEASPGGRYLVFLSFARLTGADSTGLCGYNAGQRVVNNPCQEVFLYDSESGRLSCPSCNPAGRAPLGNSSLPLNDPVSSKFQTQLRYLTDSGRLYFDSQDSLSSFDTNEGVEDLYQYEPEGVGTCSRSGGCIDLISAGRESVDSNFYAMGDEGRDVFFTTRDQLSLKDHDDLVDIYDARENGGIASETETSRGECQGEACQPLASTPNDPTPGSSTFEGAGNVNETKAAKKHAKKHKKKRHARKKHAHKRAAKSNRGGAK